MFFFNFFFGHQGFARPIMGPCIFASSYIQYSPDFLRFLMILYPVQGLLFKYTLALLSEINKLHPPLKDFSTFQSILLWKKSRNQQKTPKNTLFTSPDPRSQYKNYTV